MADRAVLGLPLQPDPDLLDTFMHEVVRSRRYSNSGPLALRLERYLQDHLDVPCAVLTSSGTSALTAALMAANLPPGSEIITTPLTFAATAQAVVAAGHRPVFVDVRPCDGTLDPDAVTAASSPRTAAVLGVHLFGEPCDVDALRDAAGDDIPVVLDAAHAFGAQVDNRGIGRLGDFSAFSLHATKLMHCGEGGVLTSNDPTVRDRLERMRNFGLRHGNVDSPGLNFKVSEFSAAVGLAVAERAEAEETSRTRCRRTYDANLCDIPGLELPTTTTTRRSELFYAVRVPPNQRALLQQRLDAGGIDSRTFGSLTARGSYFAQAHVATTYPTPIADALAAATLCLPLNSGVTEAHIATTTEIFASVLRT